LWQGGKDRGSRGSSTVSHLVAGDAGGWTEQISPKKKERNGILAAGENRNLPVKTGNPTTALAIRSFSLKDLPKIAQALLPQIYEQIESSDELKGYLARYAEPLKRLDESIGNKVLTGAAPLIARELAESLLGEKDSPFPLYQNPVAFIVSASLKDHFNAIGDLIGHRIYRDLFKIIQSLRVAHKKQSEEGRPDAENLEETEGMIREYLDLNPYHPWLLLAGKCLAQMASDQEKQKFFEGLQKEREETFQSLTDLSKREPFIKDTLKEMRKGLPEAGWKVWTAFEIIHVLASPLLALVGGVVPALVNVHAWLYHLIKGKREVQSASGQLSEHHRKTLLKICLCFEDYRGAVLLEKKGSPLRTLWESLVREEKGRRWEEEIRLHAIPQPPEDLVERPDLLRQYFSKLTGGRVISLEGKAGSGKTTLAAQLARSSKRPPFWFKFQETPNIGLMLDHLAFFLENENPDPALGLFATVQMKEVPEKLPLVMDALKKQQALLVFANFQWVLESEEAKKVFGELMQKGVAASQFVDAVLMTRKGDPWLQEMGAERCSVEKITEEEAEKILDKMGVLKGPAGDDFQKAYKQMGGTPQALKLLSAGEIQDLQETFGGKSDPFIDFFKKTYDRLKEGEKRILNYLAVFRGPLTREAIEWLLGPKAKKVGKKIRDLHKKSLLEERYPGLFDLHENYRELIYRQIADPKKYHRRAAVHHQKKAKGLGDYLEAARHHYLAEDYDRAVEAIEGRSEDFIKKGYAGREEELLRGLEREGIPLKPRSRAILFSELGTLVSSKGEGVAALAYLKRGLEIAKSLETPKDEGEKIKARKLEADLYNKIGEVCLILLKKQEAFDSHAEALKLQEREPQDREGMAETLHKMGKLSLARSNPKLAQELYELSYSNSKDIDDWRGMARTCHSMGKLFYRMGEWDNAKTGFRDALEIYTELGDLQGKADTFRSIGDVHYHRREWEEGENAFKEALKIYKRAGDRYGVAATLTSLGILERDRGDTEKAREYLENAVAIYRALDAQALIRAEGILKALQPLPPAEKVDKPAGDGDH
jgi:tetratricopeptide (TPR) repeat protein